MKEVNNKKYANLNTPYKLLNELEKEIIKESNELQKGLTHNPNFEYFSKSKPFQNQES